MGMKMGVGACQRQWLVLVLVAAAVAAAVVAVVAWGHSLTKDCYG
jgi:hypothetical protein